MKSCGGFEGNAQTFHIVARTEKKEVRGRFPMAVQDGKDQRIGLNWAYRSLAAVVKYDRIIPKYRRPSSKMIKGIYDKDQEFLERAKAAVCPDLPKDRKLYTIEASIMDVADDIAYSTYDLEDAFKSGIQNALSILTTQQAVLEKVAQSVQKSLGKPVSIDDVFRTLYQTLKFVFPADDQSSKTRAQILRAYRAAAKLATNGYLRTKFTADLVSKYLAQVDVSVDPDWPMLSRAFLPEQALFEVECLKHFTFQSTIMSPQLRIAEARGYDLVTGIFKKLDAKDGHMLMPADYRELYEAFDDDSDRKRVISDFIAGMTDRYAVEFYGRIVSEFPTSMFKPF